MTRVIVQLQGRLMTSSRAKVQLLCRDYVSSSAARDFDTAQNLSRLAASMFNAARAIRDSVCENDVSRRTEPLLLVHDALYHQCQITLHSLFVPLFSGITVDPSIGSETRRTSAKAVAQHADLFEGLLKPYLSGRADITCLPPLVGYGAFITGIVFLSTEIACRDREAHGAAANRSKKGCRMASVSAILHLLDTLRIHWRALQNPVRIPPARVSFISCRAVLTIGQVGKAPNCFTVRLFPIQEATPASRTARHGHRTPATWRTWRIR